MIKLTNIHGCPPVLRCLGGINWGTAVSLLPKLGEQPMLFLAKPHKLTTDHHSPGCAVGWAWALAEELLPWKDSPAECTPVWEQLLEELSPPGKGQGPAGLSALPWWEQSTDQPWSVLPSKCVHWALAGCGAGWNSAEATLGARNCSSEAISKFLTQWKSKTFWC